MRTDYIMARYKIFSGNFLELRRIPALQQGALERPPVIYSAGDSISVEKHAGPVRTASLYLDNFGRGWPGIFGCQEEKRLSLANGDQVFLAENILLQEEKVFKVKRRPSFTAAGAAAPTFIL